MLLARLAINPEVQDSKLAVNIFFFCHKLFLAHMDRMKHAPSLHVGQVHVLVINKRYLNPRTCYMTTVRWETLMKGNFDNSTAYFDKLLGITKLLQ